MSRATGVGPRARPPALAAAQAALGTVAACAHAGAPPAPTGPAPEPPPAARPEPPPPARPAPPAPADDEPRWGAWEPLFDGRGLGSWRATVFGGDGEVGVEADELRLGRGEPMTGVTWAGLPPPRQDYEIELEARRRKGSDFFCGLTFPVDDAALSLIVGGWGGTLVGLSSLDHRDASENETTRHLTFETGRYYRIRVRVRPGRVQAFIDDALVADVVTRGRTLSVRPEVELSRPLGLASYNTEAGVRRIALRRAR